MPNIHCSSYQLREFHKFLFMVQRNRMLITHRSCLCISSSGPLSIVVYVHLEDANDIDFKK